MASCYGWGSTASRLQPLQRGSLLFTIQFPDSCYNLILELLETNYFCTTFTSIEGKTPVMKERLNKSANCFEISFFKKK